MQPLLNLTVANIKSFVRDRAALFWTLAFPLVFIVLFGTIFSGGGDLNYKIGWVDQDGTPASAQLRTIFARDLGLHARRSGVARRRPRGDEEGRRAGRHRGPEGLQPRRGGRPDRRPERRRGRRVGPSRSTPTRASRRRPPSSAASSRRSSARVNLRRPAHRDHRATQAIQAENITVAAYFVPSILAMALMQLGLFGAIPLVQQREKLILKRLSATPLRRWMLIGSNVLMRLLIALVQTLLIVGVGARLFGVTILGSPIEVAFLVVLGALMFISLGYVVASFVPTEESANMVTSILQFPLMFLSGIFFPLDQMPDWLRTIAAALPLTYLGDALRQVMVGGTPFVPVVIERRDPRRLGRGLLRDLGALLQVAVSRRAVTAWLSRGLRAARLGPRSALGRSAPDSSPIVLRRLGESVTAEKKVSGSGRRCASTAAARSAASAAS